MATHQTLLLSSLRSLQLGDESIIREQVLSTHNSCDGREFINTDFVLSTAENILSLLMGEGTTQEAKVEKLSQLEELNNYNHIIRQLSFQIASGLNAANQHSTTIHVLSMLSSYSWEDKLVLMLAAFSIIYAEFSLVSRLHKRKGLALKMEHLKQTPSSGNHQAVVDCISSVLELTKCAVQLKQCPSYSPPQSVTSALPMAAYWVATSLVNSAPHFKVQNQLGELTTLIANILATFSPELEKKKADESYEALRYALYHNSSNKFEVFKLMFDTNLFHYTGLNSWKNQTILLLLITSEGFDISNERIHFLNDFCNHSNFHMIWIPITQNNNASWLSEPQNKLLPQFIRFVKEELFHMGEEPIIVSIDPRGRIVHPNVMHMILIWTSYYIQKNTIGVQRLYNLTPLIVKELKEGTSGVNRVVPEIDKMTSDFVRDIDDKIKAWAHLVEDRIQKAIEQSTPYDIEREKLLWQQEPACSLDLVVGKLRHHVYFDYGIRRWIDAEEYIFLYGGNNINWVREFTSKVRQLGSKIHLKIELAYIGKNKMIRVIIDKEKMSYCPLNTSDSVWRFWARLRSMFLSRIRYLDMINHFGEECDDEILQGLQKLLAFEGKNTTIEGWALLSKGKKILVCGHGAKMLRIINDYEIWKENILTKGFGPAFKDHYEMIASSSPLKSHSCYTLEYSTTLSKIPKNKKCPECTCQMHKFVTFTCCHGQDIDSDH